MVPGAWEADTILGNPATSPSAWVLLRAVTKLTKPMHETNCMERAQWKMNAMSRPNQ